MLNMFSAFQLKKKRKHLARSSTKSDGTDVLYERSQEKEMPNTDFTASFCGSRIQDSAFFIADSWKLRSQDFASCCSIKLPKKKLEGSRQANERKKLQRTPINKQVITLNH